VSRKVRVVIGLLFVVIVLVIILTGVWRWFTRQAFPRTAGTVEIAGLSQPVEIVRDEYGVAHIYAHTPYDLFFAEGYVHAQERYWQMEFQKRIATGRISELLGEAALGQDIYLRHFGFYELTRQAYEMLDEESRQIIDAYTDGVNAYIADRKPAELGLEFAILGLQGTEVEIAPWAPMDAMLWASMMVFDQSDQLRTELRNVALLTGLTEEMFMDLRPPYRPDRPTIIPSDELAYLNLQTQVQAPPGLDADALAYLVELNRHLAGRTTLSESLAELGFQAGGASNSFAVTGQKSATGMPILANDPHMGVNMPALWYQVGMHCVEKSEACMYDFRGFSLPGVPGILIGHNDRIAWGLTNASFDAEDVFVERINPANPDQYEVNGQWVDMEIRREEIVVQGWNEAYVLRVRNTRHGVVASDAMISGNPFVVGDDGQVQPYALAYAWTALEPIQSIRAVQDVIRAQNWDEFVAALQYFDAGKQNWLYADVDGNIGYIMPGKVPIRAAGDGTLPVPGWNDDFAWTGFIPYEAAPRVFNPEQDFIVTANNPQVRADEYPYLLNIFHDRGQRAQRITELIQSDSDGLTIEEVMAIQTDNASLSAGEIIPYLANLSFADSNVAAARDRLLGWDTQMHMDTPEAALFNIFWVHLIQMTFNDQLPDDNRLSGESYTSDIVYDLLQRPDSPWWDDVLATPGVETRDDILAAAFTAAYDEGVETFGEDLERWRWGDLHTITFRSPTLGSSGISFIDNIFNRGPYATSGSESVPQKTCWSVNSGYQVRCIPALRQVIDLGDLDNSWMIHSVGQSGHPMHRFYDHFIDMWRLFEYHPSNWARSSAESGPHDLLTLEPAG
jgi:penicillin G amidase